MARSRSSPALPAGADKTSRAGRARSQRQLRVGELLRHALDDVLRRGDFHDVALRGLNVTVSEVRVSPDLTNATAFVTPFGGGDPAPILAACKRGAAAIRAQVSQRVALRTVPRLSFQADAAFDAAQRIDTLLHQWHAEPPMPDASDEHNSGDDDGALTDDSEQADTPHGPAA